MGRAIDPSVGNHVFAVPIQVWGDYLADASTNQFFAVPILDVHVTSSTYTNHAARSNLEL